MNTRLPTTLTSLRSSALPLGFRCPGSLRPAELQVDPYNEAAQEGTAAHKALEHVVEHGTVEWAKVDEIAARYEADAEQVRILVAQGAKLWEDVRESFVGARAEGSLAAEVAPDVTLTGHVDILSINGTVARAGDWKTGRKDSDHEHQMRAYGTLIFLKHPELTEVTVTVLWVRDQEVENYTMRRSDAVAWLSRLVETVIEWDGVYRPGSHCQWCRKRHECAAASAHLEQDVRAIVGTDDFGDVGAALEHLTPDQVVVLYEQASLVARLAGRVRDAVRDRVREHGDVEDGKTRLTLVTERRREIDPEAAWPVLEAAGFDDEDFAACVSISASKAEKVMAQKAGRGRGAGAVRVLKASLEEAGAVRFKEIQKLQAKRA